MTVMPQRERPGFVPALEGIRGWAVVAVLLFHGQVLRAEAGYLGVSVFFTLSGYLITTLAFVEVRRTGTFDWTAFAGRRARRLLPVAAFGVALAVAVTLAIGDVYSAQRLVGDGAAAILQVANWRFIASEQDYGALFASPSAFAHYWSLSIEEQFYWVFAIVLGLRLRARRSGAPRTPLRPLRVAAWAGGGWFLSLVLQVSGAMSGAVVYHSTFTRAGEILAGVALAGLLAHRRSKELLAGPGGRRARTLGALGGAVVVVGWFVGGAPTGWITRGGLALYALASAALVLGALATRGAVVALCQPLAIRWLGRVSYALYVVHWPIFVLLDPQRTNLSRWPLFAVRVAVSLLVAWASWVTIESWTRRDEVRVAWRMVVGSTVAAVGVVVMGGVVAQARLEEQVTFEDAEAQLEAGTAAPIEVETRGPRLRMIAVGDSTALRTAAGLSTVLSARGLVDAGGGDVELGCGLNRVATSRRGGETRDVPERCDWTQRFATTVEQTDPDVVLVQFGPWETEDQQIVADWPFLHLGEPLFDEFVRDEMRGVVETLSATGAKVIWLDIAPAGDVAFDRAMAGVDPDTYDTRRRRFNDLLEELPQRFPGVVAVVRTSDWFDDVRDDTDLRPDGIHLSPEGSIDVAERWLAEEMAETFSTLGVRP
jgi:peptidoglycan/LPS O-acetylase OafA/YrhL/lysophospholipase L1-like esterase